MKFLKLVIPVHAVCPICKTEQIVRIHHSLDDGLGMDHVDKTLFDFEDSIASKAEDALELSGWTDEGCPNCSNSEG